MATPFIAMPRFKPEDSRFSNAVVASAALFLRNGIEAVRMTDIAKASAVGVATLYRHYKTKTELVVRAGTYMWKRFNAVVSGSIDNDEYASACGAERLTMIFSAVSCAYVKYPDFVRFLDEFDHMVISEGISQEELAKYGEAVNSFYPMLEDAYRTGLGDGSITRRVDFPVFYRTVAHSMMAIAQRIVRGDIIPSDDYSHGDNELACVMQMARFTLGIAEPTAENE